MELYFFLEVDLTVDIERGVETQAFKEFACTGVEEFSIDEPKVDQILGERSYSGGDLPESLLHEVESTLKKESTKKKFYFDSLSATEKFKKHIESSYAIESVVHSNTVEDWNEEWKKSYQPIAIDDKVQITPAWDKEKTKNETGHVYIYPGMGFGTGSHETTYLCLKLFSQIKNDFSHKLGMACLDFGCGSGILGIAVRFQLPAVIDLYDIDEDALVNSQQNIDLNEMNKEDFRLLLPRDRKVIEKKYDLVFANILQNVLLVEKKYLAEVLNKGGYLILSGLLAGQEQEVITQILAINKELKLVKIEQKGDWVAVLLKHI